MFLALWLKPCLLSHVGFQGVANRSVCLRHIIGELASVTWPGDGSQEASFPLCGRVHKRLLENNRFMS